MTSASQETYLISALHALHLHSPPPAHRYNMSSSTNPQGTNSPPLEATANINPIGKGDKSGNTAGGVPDANQRQGEQYSSHFTAVVILMALHD